MTNLNLWERKNIKCFLIRTFWHFDNRCNVLWAAFCDFCDVSFLFLKLLIFSVILFIYNGIKKYNHELSSAFHVHYNLTTYLAPLSCAPPAPCSRSSCSLVQLGISRLSNPCCKQGRVLIRIFKGSETSDK